MPCSPRLLTLAALVCLAGDAFGGGPTGFECNATDSTVSCCLKQHPGEWERCGASAPNKPSHSAPKTPQPSTPTVEPFVLPEPRSASTDGLPEPTASRTRSDGKPLYRIGGGSIENLRLKPMERDLVPPGVSVLLGGSPEAAARALRGAFPHATQLREASNIVGASTVELVRQAGFDVIPDPTKKLPNHGRLIHQRGIAGFVDANLQKLSRVFQDVEVP